MSAFRPGERIMLDRSLKVNFVRDLGDGRSIVEFAGATQVVSTYALSQSEA